MNRNEWITHAALLQQAEKPFALVTVLRAQAPTSGKAGDKAVVTADGHIHGGSVADVPNLRSSKQPDVRCLTDSHARFEFRLLKNPLNVIWAMSSNLGWPATQAARWSCH